MLLSGSAIASDIDSIGVENLEGKQLILHRITPKESYYSLGRKYGVNPAAIIDYNRNKALAIGTLVKIPTQRIFISTITTVGSPLNLPIATDDVLEYVVKPKETLFSISKKFSVPIQELKDFNKLKTTSLKVGQVIKIKGRVEPVLINNTVVQPIAVNTIFKTDTTKTPMAESAELDRKLPAAKYGLREIKEKGLATWIEEAELDAGRMLALHPSAPIGTIIKITNPMTQKSTFAKVVGKFTDNESTKGAIIVLTKTAAELIGAVDRRFQVSLVYGIPDNE
ncbi:MAG: LysM peptidoglycan-binding domain-containing protein [Sphingobacteriales bacterium]|nr:LysM peptidoglycan-binding domain-containing protein [Sphingobacteriales bacterium]